jgi:hypothetical protein
VFVTTADLPGAIYCAKGSVANQQLDAAGIPHADLTVNPTYELQTRLEDANTWKLGTLPSLRPAVHIIDWRGDEHDGPPDCIHLDATGVNQAASQTLAAGF